MNIGFAGAHRTGKTTLAREVAKRLNLDFIETSLTDAPVWVDVFINPSEQVSFIERVLLQEHILQYLKTKINHNPNAIYDRTFIDLLGYTYANVDKTTSNLCNDNIKNLILGCVYAQNSSFDLTIFVPPSIDIKPSENKNGKVYLSLPYITAISNNILACCMQYLDPDKFVILPGNLTNLYERVEWVLSLKMVDY